MEKIEYTSHIAYKIFKKVWSIRNTISLCLWRGMNNYHSVEVIHQLEEDLRNVSRKNNHSA